MKRLISTFTLILLILASCDSPVSNLNNNAQNTGQADNISPLALSGLSPAKADSVRTAVFQQFKARNGSEWKINWNKNQGTPLAVFSGTTNPSSGTPEEAARTFLEQNRSLFNMQQNLNNLRLIEVQSSAHGIRHVRFQQTYHGIPIYKAGYQVHIRADGRIDMANGHYYHNIQAAASPGISAASARQTALADLGGQVKLKEKIKTTRMLYRKPKDGTFAAAWKVIIPAGDPSPGTWQYFIGSGGQILHKLNLIAYTTGDGDIIEKTPDLTPTPVNETFYRLDGSGYLRGSFANVHNSTSSRAYSSTNHFVYSRFDTHFDEANVYYHLDDFRQNYLNLIGFAGEYIGSDPDIEAYVHDQGIPDAAHYDPNHEAVYYGVNTDFARRDVVIYHEFVHAAADVENGSHYIDPNPSEEGAIGEGLSDYLGGSYANRSVHLDRDMANPYYTDYSNLPRDPQSGEVDVEAHIGGEFFSAILWDLRTNKYGYGSISQLTLDGIVFDAIGRLSGFPDFLEFRDAMMAADNANHGGTHNDIIQNTFAERGVGSAVPQPPPPSSSFDVTINGPQTLANGQQGNWSANVSNGSPPYSYLWQTKQDGSSSWVNVGYQSTYSGSATQDFDLKVIVTAGNDQTSDQIHIHYSGQIH